MATLAANAIRDYDASIPPAFEDYGVVAADILYEGSFIGLDGSGHAKPLAGTDTQFVGVCAKKADNSGGAAAAINVNVRTRGKIKMPVTGVTALTDYGSKVYASDDNVLTLTSTGNKLVGKIARVVNVSATTCMVYFEADSFDVGT